MKLPFAIIQQIITPFFFVCYLLFVPISANATTLSVVAHSNDNVCSGGGSMDPNSLTTAYNVPVTINFSVPADDPYTLSNPYGGIGGMDIHINGTKFFVARGGSYAYTFTPTASSYSYYGTWPSSGCHKGSGTLHVTGVPAPPPPPPSPSPSPSPTPSPSPSPGSSSPSPSPTSSSSSGSTSSTSPKAGTSGTSSSGSSTQSPTSQTPASSGNSAYSLDQSGTSTPQAGLMNSALVKNVALGGIGLGAILIITTILLFFFKPKMSVVPKLPVRTISGATPPTIVHPTSVTPEPIDTPSDATPPTPQ